MASSEQETQFEQPDNRTPKECACKLKLFLLNCVEWTGLVLEIGVPNTGHNIKQAKIDNTQII